MSAQGKQTKRKSRILGVSTESDEVGEKKKKLAGDDSHDAAGGERGMERAKFSSRVCVRGHQTDPDEDIYSTLRKSTAK